MAANMNVILSRDVSNLGRLGEVVKVKPGYARNCLFPKRLALPVSLERVAQFEHQKRLIEHQKQKLMALSMDYKAKLAEIQVTVTAKVGEQGKLFGSIGTRDIEKALSEQGQKISHRDIKLDAPLKTVGLHQVEVRLEADVKATVNVVVVAEAKEETAKAEDEGDKAEAQDEMQAESSEELADEAEVLEESAAEDDVTNKA